MRRALAGLICKTVWRGDSAAKSALAAELRAMPFEAMTDAALVTMAERLCRECDVMRVLHMASEERYELEYNWLCPDCRDERVLFDGETGRWARCQRCNAVPVKEPEPAK